MSIEDNKEQQNTKILLNKSRINLLFPYNERQEAKKQGAKWDSEEKLWYYPSINGELPKELEKYKLHELNIEYEDKEYWKEALKSLKWKPKNKKWVCNNDDYLIYEKI